MTAVPDSAAAVQWRERAAAAQIDANTMRAQADAFDLRPDRDDMHADMRREVRRHLEYAADRLELYADLCRERALDAQQLRSA